MEHSVLFTSGTLGHPMSPSGAQIETAPCYTEIEKPNPFLDPPLHGDSLCYTYTEVQQTS